MSDRQSDPLRQPDDGQQPDPTQQPQAMPAYPSAPPIRDQESAAPLPPPTEITLAFWGWLVAAVIVLVGGLVVLGQKQQIIDALNKVDTTSQLRSVNVESQAQTAMIAAIAAAVIICVLYVFFAFKLRAGRNWARIVLTVVAALNLIDLLTNSDTASALSYVGGLIAVAAAVLSYLPKSNGYIRESKRARAAAVLGR
jgi:ABC-type Fe3+ transport system permease subunit